MHTDTSAMMPGRHHCDSLIKKDLSAWLSHIVAQYKFILICTAPLVSAMRYIQHNCMTDDELEKCALSSEMDEYGIIFTASTCIEGTRRRKK